MQAMTLQFRSSASRFGLSIRFGEIEIRVMEEFLVLTDGKPDDEEMTLAQGTIDNPTRIDLPTTRNAANARIAECREAIKVFRGRIAEAKRKNSYYDICPLLDWYRQPESTRGSPEPYLPFFGQELCLYWGWTRRALLWATGRPWERIRSVPRWAVPLTVRTNAPTRLVEGNLCNDGQVG